MITVGDYEFSVTNFVMAQNKPLYNSVTGVQGETNRISGSVVFALRATKANPKAFNVSNVTIRINGESISKFATEYNADWGFNKETLGTTAEVKVLNANNLKAAGYTKDAVAFQRAFDLKKVKGPYTGDTEKFVEVTKVEVIVNDIDTPVYVTYNVPVPAVKSVEGVDKYWKSGL